VNPFESARTEASKLREQLRGAGLDFDVKGFELVDAACKKLDVLLRRVPPRFALLNRADATIHVPSRWILVREDVPEDVAAFLVAHELGHLILHPTTPGSVEVWREALLGDEETHGVQSVEAYGARERHELQANVFAREFLLPREEARRRFLVNREPTSKISSDLVLPTELVRLQIYDAVLLPQASGSARSYSLPAAPTVAQAPAVDSDEPVTLVEAGPGTGKTSTLLLRLRRMLAQGVQAENVVVLTFSNKAARELVERARAGKIVGAEHVWIGTFHAFGLEFLRKFHDLAALGPRFPVLDKLAALALLELELPALELEAFDTFSNPHPWLENAFDAIRRSKDEGFDAKRFSESASDARQRDVARIFTAYEQALRARKSVDLTDLLCRPIDLMRMRTPAVENYLKSIHHIMVDEYQDVNRASALLVKELSRYSRSLWVVGDANQSIYAFMGASPRNLVGFKDDFPGAKKIPLALNHRSSQEIVDAFTAVSASALTAEQGRVGHGPRLLTSSNADEQAVALARQILELRTKGVPFAEQAILTFRNFDASEVVEKLEAQGIPVLHLGNIFERAEIKDLICLLQLAIDPMGVNFVRRWSLPSLQLSEEASNHVLGSATTQGLAWQEVELGFTSESDKATFATIKRLCARVSESAHPWDALANVLLEDGELLREMASRDSQPTVNALMAIWQFVHFCRSPDGTGERPTVSRLAQRIRDRVRTGEDRILRIVPPAAEGIDAVRVITTHGSKGLEFEAVHFLKATKGTYESPKFKTKHLLPDHVQSAEEAKAALRNERHNLLYVAVSRPKRYLTVYQIDGEELPSALAHALNPVSDSPGSLVPKIQHPAEIRAPDTTASMEAFVEFHRCPHRHHMAMRTGASLRDETKLHRVIDVITTRILRAMSRGELSHDERDVDARLRQEIQSFDFLGELESIPVAERVLIRLSRARALLQQGGERRQVYRFRLGPLVVVLRPEQTFIEGETTRLRFIRNDGLKKLKQPLAALLDAHHLAGGKKHEIDVATLVDGEVNKVGTIRGNTREKFADLALRMSAKQFAPAPASEKTCHFCPYMFPCERKLVDPS